ncbi:MAG: hypothetical protein A3E87_06335 [Gammaproteobacteria bacterium RIFCSPHIGHO2_12_FULL_35_23]|nr:MAG: hypothetical protein A3E87_06335 [Gammaproteobacteria bacterium RIFCSPHIGHO2_12_FULL_35_23]
MLQSIRDKSQGIIAFVIILFIALSFALWGIHNYFYGSAAQKPIVAVNGVKITQEQFATAFDRFRQAQLVQYPQLFNSQAAITAMQQQLLSSMIETTLLTQDAHKNGFSVGKDLLELTLAKMPVFQVNGQFSKFRFEQFLNGMMFSQQQFFDELSTSIMLAQVQSGFLLTSFALPYQVNDSIQLINQSRQFSYIELPAEHFLTKVTVNQQAIQQYYQTAKQQFIVPEQISLNYVSLSLNDLMSKINPTPAQLKQYYLNNINHYTIPKKWHLAHILVAVAPDSSEQDIAAAQQKVALLTSKLNKESFSMVASEYSDDLATARVGGQMPWITLLQLDDTWQKQLLVLQKAGEVSAPFKTEQGYEIVKVIAIQPAVTQSFDGVKAKVRSDYIKQKAENEFAKRSDALANITFENPTTLMPAAKQLGLTMQTTPFFNKNGGSTALLQDPKVIATAFSNDVLNQGNNSDPIQISDSQVIVLRINKKIPATIKSLAEVQLIIIAALKQSQASQLAQVTADKILQALQAGGSLTGLAKQYGLAVAQTSKPVTRNNNTGKVNSGIVNAAFNLQQPSAGIVVATVAPIANGGYAVVRLDQVIEGSLPKANNQAVAKYYRIGIANGLGQLEYGLYVNGLHQSSKIKVYSQPQDLE